MQEDDGDDDDDELKKKCVINTLGLYTMYLEKCRKRMDVIC